MGFSRSQNVSFSSLRDNIYNPKCLMAFEKSILHLGISVPGCFLVCELWYYYNIMKNIIWIDVYMTTVITKSDRIIKVVSREE
mgnify:CR=1 FL=1